MNFAIPLRKKQKQMLIIQALAKNILNEFKKIAVFGAEKKVLRSAKVAASAAASRCRKNGQKAQKLLAKAALQRSFELVHVFIPKLLLNALKAGSVAFVGIVGHFMGLFARLWNGQEAEMLQNEAMRL
jgi:hypothetical protein